MNRTFQSFRNAVRLLSYAVPVTAAITLPVEAQDKAPGSAANSAAQVVQAFAQAADRRTVTELEALLHPAFRVVFSFKPGTSPTVLDRAQFLQMVRDGKIGGADRKVVVSGLNLAEGFVTATAVMSRADATFSGNYTLVEQGGKWLLLQEAVLMTAIDPRK